MEAVIITINGLAQPVTARHLDELMTNLQLSDRAVAVALNDSVIPNSELMNTPLKAGDRIEIVQAVCGG